MKKIISFITFSISLAAIAGSGDMGGGYKLTNKLLSIPNSSIEAVISKEGIYARLIDLQEGFESFKGLDLAKEKTTINFSKPQTINVERILLNDGREISIDRLKRVSGGDMGGG